MKFVIGLMMAMVSVPAMACMPMPIEQNTRAKNALAMAALNSLYTSVDQVSSFKIDSIKVEKYEWVKSDGGYQCHDRQTLSAQFTIESKRRTGTCTYVVAVTAVQSFYENAPKDKFETETKSEACSLANPIPTP